LSKTVDTMPVDTMPFHPQIYYLSIHVTVFIRHSLWHCDLTLQETSTVHTLDFSLIWKTNHAIN